MAADCPARRLAAADPPATLAVIWAPVERAGSTVVTADDGQAERAAAAEPPGPTLPTAAGEEGPHG